MQPTLRHVDCQDRKALEGATILIFRAPAVSGSSFGGVKWDAAQLTKVSK